MLKRPALPGPHGIDLTAPGGIDALLAFHRAVFGDARMEDGAGGDGAGGDGAAGGAPGGEGGEGAGGAGGTGDGAAEGKVEDLPDWAQRIIRDARREAGDHRVAAKTAAEQAAETARAAMAQEIGKALGLVKGDDAPDPAKLTEQLTATQAQARQAAVELAVFKTAAKHQGDPNALLDSRAFMTKVKDLDPTAQDFGDQVDAAIKAAITDNPKLKAVQAAGSSSVDHAGGSGEGGARPKSIREALARS